MSYEHRSPKISFLGFFAHPLVGILGSVASVAGVILAVYFYQAAKLAPRVTVYAHPVRATVVKSGQASALTVSFGRAPIRSDITAVQVAIWNAGNQPVRRSDILEPIELSLPVPILEATIRKTSRAVVRLALSRSEMQQGRLGIDWNILEPSDGGIIQIVYAGVPTAPLSVRGSVVGQASVSQIKPEPIQSAAENYENIRTGTKWLFWTLLCVSAVAVIHTVVMSVRDRKVRFARVFIALVTVVYVLLAYREFTKIAIGPPFGF